MSISKNKGCPGRTVRRNTGIFFESQKSFLTCFLDGGMGTELVRCGVKEVDSDPLWGAYANIHQPASVIQERLPIDVI